MNFAVSRRHLPHSTYTETARLEPPTPTLSGRQSARVVIVGCGFTGLSAALHLALDGIDTIVVEANEIGWGASGRNGGQVNPGLKWEPDALEAAFGADLGHRMAELGDAAPQLVFDLIAKHGIACAPTRGGTIRAAVSKRSEIGIRDHVRQWQSRGADIRLIDRSEVAEIAGTSAYALASHDLRGGSVNPLGFARGLAAAAIAAGARIFCGSHAWRLRQFAAGWLLDTVGGSVLADTVVIATNGYSDDLWPGLRRSIVPVYSSIAATEPLPPELAAAIMPARPVLYEMSAAYAYYRVDAEGRLLMGGRSVLRDSSDMADYRGLIAHAERLFPALKSVRWTHCWNGRTAITPDHLPHIHEPAEGVHIGLGYNGRGIAMATAVGRMLARRVAGGRIEELDLPVTGISPIFGHFAWPVAVQARLRWESLRERLGV
eukprot:gene21018-21777_t